MTTPSKSNHDLFIGRLFLVQIILVAIGSILLIVMVNTDLGFFWPAFLGGAFGSSVAMLRKIQKGTFAPERVGQAPWVITLMPILYGGIMAGVTYFLFLSGVLSGDGGDGLLTSNLFPSFGPQSTGLATATEFLAMRPADLPSAGKLLVWCFLGGYSESFVTGMLGRLESSTAAPK